jgi:hypothetical protein
VPLGDLVRGQELRGTAGRESSRYALIHPSVNESSQPIEDLAQGVRSLHGGARMNWGAWRPGRVCMHRVGPGEFASDGWS